MTADHRLVLACVAVSAWLVMVLTGHVLGGATHLLLVAGLGLFPWRDADE